MLVLGVESSCDDTAAAVVLSRRDGSRAILSNVTLAQYDRHAAYGGVVPEIAARAHVERIDGIIAQAIEISGHTFAELDAVAATAGPGLIGGVMVGLTAAKAVALAHELPLIPVNHLEGHALSVRMSEEAAFPYLLLLISGGHTQLIEVSGVGAYRRLGTTIDDAAGEAFDKSAKLLGLGQPGGPMIEAAAKGGRTGRFTFPKPLARREGCDFSLSGLKTALRLEAEAIERPTAGDVADLAAAFQAAIAEHLADRTARAMGIVEQGENGARTLVAAGGVAANGAIRARLEALTQDRGWRLVIPPAKYCTDNGAMIAWAGIERLRAGLAPDFATALAIAPRARWPLAEPIAGREHGGGKKGPKA
ncbi:MAG: tRNA (adenosine(37)-N6)-threonylcarbamoyltransferase complex transferase subunit TsaD [Alphaproteobacteria bacterium RIFCSPHIGHO2_12_FULL_63_12]|nr:MAG: tRNA (adenosine(37)-N6)-threonylcarbamoyltransferase complex transferase subunit TsaD [Alphaproteobacteria bacterium RIFCSPHIGHO2_12_FULL_63_12]